MNTVQLHIEGEENYFMREAFSTLRTNVLFSGTDVKIITITSCYPNEGKTTVSLGISKSFAEADKRVLFIDADLRKSVMVSRYTDQTVVHGLSQLLSGQCELSDAVYHTQFPGMDVIFAGQFPPNPAEMVGSETFRKLLEAVSPHYDYVILDAPPLGLVVDAAVIAGASDGAILVISRGKVKTGMAKNVTEQLKKSGCRILGAVLNNPGRPKKQKG